MSQQVETRRWSANTIVEPQRFREIMGSFPTGVTVVTATDSSGQPVGFTANAVTSVSLDPPMLLVCFAQSLFTLDTVERTRRFAVNFLKSDQQEIALRFASRGDNKFSDQGYSCSDLGLPILDGNLAYAECEVCDFIEAGDHTIVVGLITHGETRDGQPLMYFQGQFGAWPNGKNGNHGA